MKSLHMMKTEEIGQALGIDSEILIDFVLGKYREIVENDGLGEMTSMMDFFEWGYSDRFWDEITLEEENEIIRVQFNEMYASRLHSFLSGLTATAKREIKDGSK